MHPAGGKDPELSFAGDATVSSLRTIDNALEEDFFNVDRLEAAQDPFRDRARFAVDRARRSCASRLPASSTRSDQVLNVAAVFDPVGTAAALKARKDQAGAGGERGGTEEATSNVAASRSRKRRRRRRRQSPPSRPPVLVETGMPIRIREVRIDAGRMDFADYFIQPNFAARHQRRSTAR